MRAKELRKLLEETGSLFDGLQRFDLIAPVVKHLESGSFFLTEENRIGLKLHRPPQRPWVSSSLDPQRLCNRWLDIYYNYYGIIPQGCRHCWKVVVSFNSLEKLFELVEIQEGMGLHAKAGMERRPYGATMNTGLGFWYSPLGGGLRGGRKLYGVVKEHLEKVWPDGDWHLILKRGCTEMQQSTPSDQWDERADYYDRVEELLEATWDIPKGPLNELTLQKIHTMNLWIQWSAERTEDYLQFTGGKKFNVGQVTYQDSIHSEKDFPGLLPKLNLEVV